MAADRCVAWSRRSPGNFFEQIATASRIAGNTAQDSDTAGASAFAFDRAAATADCGSPGSGNRQRPGRWHQLAVNGHEALRPLRQLFDGLPSGTRTIAPPAPWCPHHSSREVKAEFQFPEPALAFGLYALPGSGVPDGLPDRRDWSVFRRAGRYRSEDLHRLR